MARRNSLISGDTIFEVSPAYRRGAQACRDGYTFRHNPHRSVMGQSHHDWDAGFGNEESGEHIRFGVDIITAQNAGRMFEEDPAVPRDKDHVVVMDWYHARRTALAAHV